MGTSGFCLITYDLRVKKKKKNLLANGQKDWDRVRGKKKPPL